MESPSESNPFQPPARQRTSGRIPFEGTPEEAAAIRQRGINRESTLRGMGVMKLLTVVALLLIGVAVLVADRDALQSWAELLEWPLPTSIWQAGAAVLLAVTQLVTAAGLWWLAPWGRWLQAASSAVMVLAAVYAMAVVAGGPSQAAATGGVFGAMLLLAVHVILLLIVLGRPSGEVCGEEYAVVCEANGPLDKRHVWPKVLLLGLLWLAGAAGLGILAAVARA